MNPTEPADRNPYRDEIDRLYDVDEAEAVGSLLADARMEPADHERMNNRARDLVQSVRDHEEQRGLLDAFMQQYDLSSEEGIVLMCLAEALLRIPDNDTAEKLIAR